MPRLYALLLLALAPLAANAEEMIRVYNWNDYIAPQVLKDFEAETGIKVEYHTFSTAEELNKIMASGEAIDVAVPSNDTIPELIEAKAILPLDMSRLPNRTHLDKQLLSKLAAVDPDNRYAVPYLWGAVGLAINTPQAEAAYGGPLPDSWSVLFDPQSSALLSGCGISVLDASDETLSLVLNYQGREFSRSAPSRIRRAGELLKNIRPNLRYVDSEQYIEDLNNGTLCMAMAWVGDALAAKQAGQPVDFIVPEEGSVLFIDNLVIPSTARRADLAHRFIDYLMQPKVAAKITTETLYPNANSDSKQFLDASLQAMPDLYPNIDIKRRLYTLKTLSDEQKAVRDEVWQQFTAQ
ncbi:polyamine ABC transporter substrate-binding protein [Pseudomonas sp. M30-35]|uniref:polyamine ABC transporter substrate-binding protein n=1 Tax=Pseudomonas sp. M30-35 TaxID=1981174 RepID=UPI000B3CC8B2|nr:polyamine ABC transporter substrate-binding protein [Pseudomonas sp. M30-35]ARU86715.1 polyamine ABC transporter substrate-binding protein [Pseudomonas sp. M30-35]